MKKIKEKKSQRKWCGLAGKQCRECRLSTKELLLLILKDENSRALFEFLYILPTLCVCVRERERIERVCVYVCLCVCKERFLWF